MTSDVSGLNEYVREAVAGQCTIVAALVVALDEAGVLPKDKYVDALRRLWCAMPEAAAVSETGAVIEQVLDLLNADACSTLPSHDNAFKQSVQAIVRGSIDDDVAA